MAGAVPQLSRGAALVGRRPKHPLVHVPTEARRQRLPLDEAEGARPVVRAGREEEDRAGYLVDVQPVCEVVQVRDEDGPHPGLDQGEDHLAGDVRALALVGGGGGTGTTYYSINNVNSGKVMDVQAPNTSAGSLVGQYTWNGNFWQEWSFVATSGGYYNIVSRNSGLCLDVNGASTADGAGIIQWYCGSGTNQQFLWRASGSNFQVVARHSGKCVDVVGSSTADGALLEQRTCTTANNMLWSRTVR
jgi:Ricin-type beta-trefoil lectin domain-like